MGFLIKLLLLAEEEERVEAAWRRVFDDDGIVAVLGNTNALLYDNAQQRRVAAA